MSGIQYTIRGVPEALDTELREEAAQHGKSLNAHLIDKLTEACRLSAVPKKNGLEKFIGTWIEDPDFDEVMEDFSRVDEGEWE